MSSTPLLPFWSAICALFTQSDTETATATILGRQIIRKPLTRGVEQFVHQEFHGEGWRMHVTFRRGYVHDIRIEGSREKFEKDMVLLKLAA